MCAGLYGRFLAYCTWREITKKRLGWDKEATGEMDDEKTSDLLRNR